MSWKSIADLIAADGQVAMLGAPMEAGSVTPGRCDLAPGTVRKAFRRFSTYNVENGSELFFPLRDLGDVPVQGLSPADGFEPIRNASAAAVADHRLTLLILDAHFDMRETDGGPMNGNPVRCLLEDGLPGRNVCQIGLAPFANTARMHADACAAGIGVYTIADCFERGILGVLNHALARTVHLDVLMVDFDIDVIDRAQCPGAPGARPGGMPAAMFFAAARRLAADPRVKLVDLTEFDPSLDVGDITALTAGRWVCEVLAGFAGR